MFKRIIPLVILLALFAGQAWGALSATNAQIDTTNQFRTKIRTAITVSAPDSVVNVRLWWSTISKDANTFILYGSPAYIHQGADTTIVTGLRPSTKYWFKSEIIGLDTTARTALSAWSAVDSVITFAAPVLVFTGKDSTVNAIRLRMTMPAAAPDSGVTTWSWYYGTTNPPTTLAATISTTITGALDTSAYLTGLYNGTLYYVQVKATYQDTTTGARTTHVIWSSVSSLTTKNIGQAIAVVTDSAAIDKTYRNFRIQDTWYSDSVLIALGMQYADSTATSWTWATVQAHYGNAVGRDSVGLGTSPGDDTLCALSNNLTIDLLPGTAYKVRVIGYYGAATAQAYRGSDTSNTVYFHTAVAPGTPTGFSPSTMAQGEVAPGIWHFWHKYNQLNDNWNSPHFLLNQGYKKIIFEVQKFGFDNNHPADSSKLYLMNVNHATDVGYTKMDSALFNGLGGALATAATGVMALPDTASGRKIYVLSVSEVRTVARAANDTTFINAANPEFYFNHVAKDSAGDFGASLDTTTIDDVNVEIWGYGVK